ncbi:MAG: sigma-70 family RNA polymerase sigma factor [Gemmataceae bacterium]|nr:sigma-70 family RNA polymerase sigma factor [Gemmataceae bacterium]
MHQGPRPTADNAPAQGAPTSLLYHFCRLQLPTVAVPPPAFERHLQRTFRLHQSKAGEAASWPKFLENLYLLDWFVACACLDGNARAWEHLFAARAGRTDCLLMDALRARAARLYPRDEERQESAVTEFWGHLYAAESAEGLAVLARYDGLRPLVPWLIRVFQNWHVSQLRRRSGIQALPEDDVALPLPTGGDARWHEAFCQAARDWVGDLKDTELLILGLRLRYRLSQREVATLLGMHEGTVSRRTDSLRERCLEHIAQRLLEQGWTGDDLSDYVRTEMQGVLLDDPRLSVDHLAHLLARQGKSLPA